MSDLQGPSQSTSNRADMPLAAPAYEYLPHVIEPLAVPKSTASERLGPILNAEGNSLCPICYEFDEAAFKDDRNYSISWFQFSKNSGPSVKRKCKTCMLLRMAISQFEPRWGEDSFETRYTERLHDGIHRKGSERMNISANIVDGLVVSLRTLTLELYRQPESSKSLKFAKLIRKSDPWKTIQERPHVPQDAQSSKTYRRIRGWLSDCTDNHKICPSNVVTPLPSRVIDVRNLKALKLFMTTSEKGRYVALSHRWGLSALTTTIENLESRKRNIVWTQLPKVFQDAVTITRELGLNYLWIDSLCIIQDDIEDWEQQSAQMASIYANAYVTIAATSSDSSDSTCLSLSNRSEAPVELNHPSIFARKPLSHGHMFNSNENNSTYPLFGRAWCFQERLLSTRTLHYTRDEIIFECRTGYQCECGSIWSGAQSAVSDCLKLAYAQILEESRKFGDGDRYIGPTFTASCNKETLLWFRILGEYTTTQITFDRDTLPALSGVADKMPLDLMGKYLAGLWEQNLIYGLLWRSQDGLECRRHCIYVAPSFSWASRSGPITFPYFTSRYKPSAEVIEGNCQPAGFNITGRVRSGFVKLRGSVITVKFTKAGTNPVVCVLNNGSSVSATITIDSQEALEIEDGSVVYCLSMLEYGRPTLHYTLVLTESKFHSGDFERIGMANDVPGDWFRGAISREVKII